MCKETILSQVHTNQHIAYSMCKDNIVTGTTPIVTIGVEYVPMTVLLIGVLRNSIHSPANARRKFSQCQNVTP